MPSALVPSSALPDLKGRVVIGTAVPVVDVESVTGLPKGLIRKWEDRYGFPRPDRDEYGDRVYPADQVTQLQLIRRLLGGGMRPGSVVGLDLAALEQLAAAVSSPAADNNSESVSEVLAALRRHDLAQLSMLLRGLLCRQGLSLFVRETVTQLNVAVGDSWLRGDLKVFEEHLYTEAVQTILLESITMIGGLPDSPRLMLTTAPGELHTTGLLMANAILALERVHCIRLGAQTPVAEVATAAAACGVDIVGVSFSLAHPKRDVVTYLSDLRTRLDPAVEVWAGGGGVARLRRTNGIRFVTDLDKINLLLREWRKRGGNKLPEHGKNP